MLLSDPTRLTLGIIASLLNLVSFVPYIISTFKGKVSPHLFTWLTWATLTLIGFISSITSGGSEGAWYIGIDAIFCISIAILAIKYGHKNLKFFDFICLILSGITVVIWMLTKSPLIAVSLASFVFTIGYLPTFRKSYSQPRQEYLGFYLISIFKQILGILALQTLIPETYLFPTTIAIGNFVYVLFNLIRRKAIESAPSWHNKDKIKV